MFHKYDVIVVGAGHAGCEAAAAAANMGSRTLLITMNMGVIGQMSCNPAMGGVAKGQIVREIDALGGYSGIVSDRSAIQFRMLNRSKGPAMWSPRTQNDRNLFAATWRELLEKTPNLDFWQDMVTGILVENGSVRGVKTSLGNEIRSKAVVLTNGTFLNGIIHIGEKQFGGGRSGERAATGLTEELEKLGFESGRMKTGTPPRIDGRSLDYSKMEEQFGDAEPGKFSYSDTPVLKTQRSCFITYTSPEVHELLRTGFDKSPMFNGRIRGLGPRYCPSIEDKIDRFASKDRHQIFVEPEGWNTVEIYVNGFSTSLPEDVQFKALQKVPGFEHCKFFRPGYAIEYDYFPPTQISATLETKLIEGLYFAGQINGTTGYEEAAGQGLMAGINAHRKLSGQAPFILERSQAYIGVLIDDLITKGTDEPYRMFTSRAEHRLNLRQDNADLRLTPLAHEIGLASEERMQRVVRKKAYMQDLLKKISRFQILPEQINEILVSRGTSPVVQKTFLRDILLRPQVSSKDLPQIRAWLELEQDPLHNEALEQVEVQLKYQNYLDKEDALIKKMEHLDAYFIPDPFDYGKVKSLSHEAREKLSKVQPRTLAQASRISGISPADITVMMVHLGV